MKMAEFGTKRVLSGHGQVVFACAFQSNYQSSNPAHQALDFFAKNLSLGIAQCL